MDDLALFAHALAGTRAFQRLFGTSRGSEVHELEGVTATLVPNCPERSVVNSVSYDEVEELAAALEEVAGLYAEAGVHRWTVWVPERDRAAAELLERAGHVLDSEPAAMGLGLDSAAGPAGCQPPDWERAEDASAVGPLNDLAYGYDGSFTRALDGVPTHGLDVWVARHEDRPVTCLITFDRDEDRHVTLVATAPAARGRGWRRRCWPRLWRDARERGLWTSSLVATQDGRAAVRAARLPHRGHDPDVGAQRGGRGPRGRLSARRG